MRRLVALGLAALAVGACSRGDPMVELRLFAMGTWVDLSLPASAARGDPALIATIETELGDFGRDYYAWGDGELAALNDGLTVAGEFEVSPDMGALLGAAQRISEASEGAFDPGVGALVELWGFHAPNDASTPPDAVAIADRLAAYGSIADLSIDDRRVTVRADRADGQAPAFRLDLGGIAKGEIVDRIAGLLAGRDISPALVNAGGDLRVVGEPEGRSWRIGIKAPRADGLLGSIALYDGEAAFSSGDYERFYEHDGEREHHILDPRSGAPVRHTQAITVVATDGRTADAAATALFVAGPDAWPRIARALGIRAVLRVDGAGRVEMTSAMRDRFQPGEALGSDIIIRSD